ncbi:GntR family transcriptional regulator [Jeotgalibacillus malaysiensis]|uniref:GntR family transcriptional regulator n=1 Tax=Jeotgalibacillus malaysiensis TaxID=1508404 RepID=A0A0B5AIL9_9BACL|nr:GntR family transcriptional regulator [Jeotgalibacillus malaysiensis]AJD90230.1 GntR family transcriptional regulator [Jeotgalibacillus malaysiensis]
MSKPSSSAYVLAYETIRDRILNGELEGGTKLTEERLAEELGVSRTPIRESIRRLEQEGLIKKKRVVKPTESDLRHMFQVRMILEGHAARTAAAYMTDDELTALAECIHIGRTGTIEEIMKANKQFHDLIVQASRNPVMIDIIDQMQSIIYLFRKTVVYHKRTGLIDEHEEIYEAIKGRDAEKAELLMKKHLQADLDFSVHVL